MLTFDNEYKKCKNQEMFLFWQNEILLPSFLTRVNLIYRKNMRCIRK